MGFFKKSNGGFMHRKKNSRVFIFGAGVSKAAAGAPLMEELFSKMRERYEYEKQRKDLSEGNNRVLLFEEIEEFMEKLERKAKKRFNQIEKNEKNLQIKSKIREDIEYLITLLDIHTEHGSMFKFEQPGVDWDTYPFIPFDNIDRKEIMKIRNGLETYLYLCLCNLKDKNGIFEKFFQRQLRPDDYLVTFNYDLLTEEALLQINKWSPLGGYVGVEEFGKKQDREDLINSNLNSSAHKILKLHGSINWEWECPWLYPETHPGNANPVINLDNLEKWGFFFPELEKILKREPTQPSGRRDRLISKGYTGGYSPLPWILPSYVKVFSKAPFLVKIWREAQRVLSQAKHLVVLGYSFPEADSQSQLLLASLPDDCSILIVDPDAEKIKVRIDKLFQFPDVLVENIGFEEWVKKGCPEI